MPWSGKKRTSAAIVSIYGVIGCSSGHHDDGAPRRDSGTMEGGTQLPAAMDGARLAFIGADGSKVLESVSGKSVLGGVPYAAFGFSTADEPELLPPSFGAVPAVPAPPSSSRHVATGLHSKNSTPTGFVAELDTDDPTRTLTLTVAELDGGAVQVDMSVTEPVGVKSMFATFQSDADEAFHGFGGRRESTNLRGQAFSNWVFDYRFPDVGTSYYYPQPMFVSSKGYAARLDTDQMAYFRLGSDENAWRASVVGSTMRLVVIPKKGVDALKTMTDVTGRHRVAPTWSMGPTLSRTVQLYVDKPDVYLAKVQADVKHVLNDDLGVESYAYEGWARLSTDFVRSTNAELRAAGIHPMLYLRCFVSDDSAATEPLGRITEAVQAGYVATKADGSPYYFTSPSDGSNAAVVDFTNPAARTWWKGLVTQMLDLGADGFMNDFGEQVLPDMVFSDGSTGGEMHNRYPILQHQTTREAVDAYMTAHPDRQLYFFVRAGYAGSPGTEAYENAQFPGDETVDWNPKTGLPSIVPDMLNRSILGGYGFTTDIGGYADWTAGAPDAEIYVRWTEAAVFTPFFRVHNSALSGVKMPWDFDATTLATWKEMAALHVRARPLITRLWQDATTTAAPPIRPLWLDDTTPNAPGGDGGVRNHHGDDEWMVGTDLLVAPVLAKGATAREVWFPEGCFQLHGEGASFAGPSVSSVDAPVGVLPWFTRCGTSPLD